MTTRQHSIHNHCCKTPCASSRSPLPPCFFLRLRASDGQMHERRRDREDELQVPYKTLFKITEAMPPPAAKLLFVWSTGRCGSTLLSQLLHTHPGVTASMSEPPCITFLHKLCKGVTTTSAGTKYVYDGITDGSRETWVRRFSIFPALPRQQSSAGLLTARTHRKPHTRSWPPLSCWPLYELVRMLTFMSLASRISVAAGWFNAVF